MNKILIVILLTVLTVNCKSPEARRPVGQKSGSYINKSIERNKELNKAEEKAIQEILAQSPDKEFFISDSGFWYYYNVRDTSQVNMPETGDLVTFEYNLSTLSGQPIVTTEEMGPQTYQIEQSNQELMSGLRDGLKLMKEGETVTFLFPSHKAFGYYGYENKIGSNLPIQSRVTLTKIETRN